MVENAIDGDTESNGDDDDIASSLQLLGIAPASGDGSVGSGSESVSTLPRFLREHRLTSQVVFERVLAYRDALPEEVDVALLVSSTPAVLLVKAAEIPSVVGTTIGAIEAELAVSSAYRSRMISTSFCVCVWVGGSTPEQA